MCSTTPSFATTDSRVARFGNRVWTRALVCCSAGGIYRSASFRGRGPLIQKGPSFPQPLDMTVARANGRVTVRYTDDGEQKVVDERLELPPDLANGLILTLLKNFGPSPPPTRVSMVAATPKPRLVRLAVTSVGEEPFSLGGSTRQATHYVVKVEIGGVTGLLAPLLGRQPPDSHVWILGGDVPAFVKSEGPLYLGGPVWRIELTSPVWPRRDTSVVGDPTTSAIGVINSARSRGVESTS